MASPTVETERLICEAIADRRLIAFSLNGHERIAEPHDFGVADGKQRLFFFQVAGSSQSGPPHGWRWGDLAKIGQLRVVEARFAGPRPVPSGRHRRWDRLIASVSRPPAGLSTDDQGVAGVED